MKITLYRDNYLNLDVSRKNDTKEKKVIDFDPTYANIINAISGRKKFSGWTIDKKTKVKLIEILEKLAG